MAWFDAVMLRVFAFPRPVVAAIGGHAVAGGAVLALACDARVMGAKAGRIGLNEIRLGVPFPASALEIVRHAVPARSVESVLYEGELFDPRAALERGLVTEVVEGDVVEAARRVCGRLAAAPAAPSRPSRPPSRGRPWSGRGRRSRRFDAPSWTRGTRPRLAIGSARLACAWGADPRAGSATSRQAERSDGGTRDGHRGGHRVDLAAHVAPELFPGGVEGPADDRPGLPRAARDPGPLDRPGRAAGGMEGRAHGAGDPEAVRDARARHGLSARERPPRERRVVPARGADRAGLRERALSDGGVASRGSRRHPRPGAGRDHGGPARVRDHRRPRRFSGGPAPWPSRTTPSRRRS